MIVIPWNRLSEVEYVSMNVMPGGAEKTHLKEILRLVRSLQPEHVLLFGVVVCFCRQRVMYSNGIVDVVRELENKFY